MVVAVAVVPAMGIDVGWSDDFESYASQAEIGEVSPDWIGPGPGGTSNWVCKYPNANTPFATQFAAKHTFWGGVAMSLALDAPKTTGTVQLNWDAAYQLAGNAQWESQIGVRILNPDMSNPGGYVAYSGSESSNPAGQKQWFYVNNGAQYMYDPNDGDRVPHTHTLHIDLDNDEYWLEVQGIGTTLKQPGAWTPANGIGGFAFYVFSDSQIFGDRFGMDNVSLTPEPTTMGLLMLGGVIVTARRRR